MAKSPAEGIKTLNSNGGKVPNDEDTETLSA